MPHRVLVHGNAPASSTPEGLSAMEPGRWADVCEQGQFLLDVEFLSRHTHPGEGRVRPTVIANTACVYTQSPAYLNEIAFQFPWVHFYAFRHTEAESEYDPAQPALVSASAGPTIQTDRNKTTSSLEFTKESAVALSRVKEDNPDTHSAVLICHGESLVQQLVYHVLMRADYSMLDIQGPIPTEYLDGDIVLPIQIARNKVFACMVAHKTCRPTTYNPELYLEEMCKSHPAAPHDMIDMHPKYGSYCRLLPVHATRERGIRHIQ